MQKLQWGSAVTVVSGLALSAIPTSTAHGQNHVDRYEYSHSVDAYGDFSHGVFFLVIVLIAVGLNQLVKHKN